MTPILPLVSFMATTPLWVGIEPIRDCSLLVMEQNEDALTSAAAESRSCSRPALLPRSAATCFAASNPSARARRPSGRPCLRWFLGRQFQFVLEGLRLSGSAGHLGGRDRYLVLAQDGTIAWIECRQAIRAIGGDRTDRRAAGFRVEHDLPFGHRLPAKGHLTGDGRRLRAAWAAASQENPAKQPPSRRLSETGGGSDVRCSLAFAPELSPDS